jgi:hypothetical protein
MTDPEPKPPWDGRWSTDPRRYGTEWARQWRVKNRERNLANGRSFRQRHRIELRRRRNEKWWRYKYDVMRAYSGCWVPFCAICGEIDMRVLTIDHIGGGGNVHRRSIRSPVICSHLKATRYPSGFRVLCMNDQFRDRYERLRARSMAPLPQDEVK